MAMFSPQSVVNASASDVASLLPSALAARQAHDPGIMPMPSLYQALLHVCLKVAPAEILPVDMEIGLPDHAADFSREQVRVTGDLSRFLMVQTVGVLQQVPAIAA